MKKPHIKKMPKGTASPYWPLWVCYTDDTCRKTVAWAKTYNVLVERVREGIKSAEGRKALRAQLRPINRT